MMKAHGAMGSNIPSGLKTYTIKLLKRRMIAAETLELTFEKPVGFVQQAGQHVRLTVLNPMETDAEGNSRFYSLVNAPYQKQLVIAVRMRDTAHKRVLNVLQIGEQVQIDIMAHSSKSSFVLAHEADHDAVFIVGGIGIVPAYAIIKDALQRKLPINMTLLYANKSPETTVYLKELEILAAKHSRLSLVATMTDPTLPKQAWRGKRGRFTSADIQAATVKLAAPDFYIAGVPEMVRETEDLLKDMGIRGNRIKSEMFEGFTKLQTATTTSKRSVVPILIAFVAILFLLMHLGLAAGLTKISITVPTLAALLIGIVMGVALTLKFKAIKSFAKGE